MVLNYPSVNAVSVSSVSSSAEAQGKVTNYHAHVSSDVVYAHEEYGQGDDKAEGEPKCFIKR